MLGMTLSSSSSDCKSEDVSSAFETLPIPGDWRSGGVYGEGCPENWGMYKLLQFASEGSGNDRLNSSSCVTGFKLSSNEDCLPWVGSFFLLLFLLLIVSHDRAALRFFPLSDLFEQQEQEVVIAVFFLLGGYI